MLSLPDKLQSTHAWESDLNRSLSLVVTQQLGFIVLVTLCYMLVTAKSNLSPRNILTLKTTISPGLPLLPACPYNAYLIPQSGHHPTRSSSRQRYCSVTTTHACWQAGVNMTQGDTGGIPAAGAFSLSGLEREVRKCLASCDTVAGSGIVC